MKKLLIVLLSAIALTAVAQQKKVAVYVTGQQTGINNVLGDQLLLPLPKVASISPLSELQVSWRN